MLRLFCVISALSMQVEIHVGLVVDHPAHAPALATVAGAVVRVLRAAGITVNPCDGQHARDVVRHVHAGPCGGDQREIPGERVKLGADHVELLCEGQEMGFRVAADDAQLHAQIFSGDEIAGGMEPEEARRRDHEVIVKRGLQVGQVVKRQRRIVGVSVADALSVGFQAARVAVFSTVAAGGRRAGDDSGEIKARAKRLAVSGGDVAGDAASGRDFHLVPFPAAWYNGFAAFVRRCVLGWLPRRRCNACGAFDFSGVLSAVGDPAACKASAYQTLCQ